MSFGESRGGRRKSPLQSRRLPPPFALDFDDGNVYDVDDSRSMMSNSSSWATLSTSGRGSATGYRKGGPKEARLHRVALLSKTKETDHLFPVKVKNIPRATSPEKLQEGLSHLGEIGDVYIPLNMRTRTPAKDFAVIRFNSEDSARRALSPENKERILEGRSVSLEPLDKQQSFFSRGSGYMGISNEPCGERPPTVGPPEQAITLGSCKSRSGYPWGSVRELKYLNPQPDRSVLDMYAIRVEIPRHVTVERLEMIFGMYGKLGAVTCPTPMLILEFTGDPNDGFAFVRYEDKRDLDRAFGAIERGDVVIDGFTVTGKVIPPRFWPNDKSRRYY